MKNRVADRVGVACAYWSTESEDLSLRVCVCGIVYWNLQDIVALLFSRQLIPLGAQLQPSSF
jgi:hypothetical protein